MDTESATVVWSVEESGYTGYMREATVDDVEDTVTIDQFGICHVNVALDDWDAIVAAVAEAREAGGRVVENRRPDLRRG